MCAYFPIYCHRSNVTSLLGPLPYSQKKGKGCSWDMGGHPLHSLGQTCKENIYISNYYAGIKSYLLLSHMHN